LACAQDARRASKGWGGFGPAGGKEAVAGKAPDVHRVALVAAQYVKGRCILTDIEADMALPALPAAAPEGHDRAGLGHRAGVAEATPGAGGQQFRRQRFGRQLRLHHMGHEQAAPTDAIMGIIQAQRAGPGQDDRVGRGTGGFGGADQAAGGGKPGRIGRFHLQRGKFKWTHWQDFLLDFSGFRNIGVSCARPCRTGPGFGL